MSNRRALSEPRLPPELEHRIFKIAALARPIGVPTLMLVARRIKIWVEPILYRVVFLKDSAADYTDVLHYRGLPTFTPDALKKRSQQSFGHVRHLFIDDDLVGETALTSWLLACTGATNLYAWLICTPGILDSISGFMNIQYLTIDVRALCDTTVPLPLFLTVTHLELLDFTNESDNVDCVCRNLSLIPRLTHVALNWRLDSALSHATLCANPQLQCIVFLSPMAPLDGSPLLDDDRFACINPRVHFYPDWLNGAVFGQDFWYFADAFLAARRAGTIDRTYPRPLK
ncbi:hypothetical protein MSAN_00866400 [Mycena sanguinolenta]|uniref:Uncharacterized protein n=1 Tax=Mycena sanguinolenta TaxID=230812 RepID=A0A8H7DDY2_9AGAR|nr:hypothetical protein MSAN_00866400 [Mycena sanguinolenta]